MPTVKLVDDNDPNPLVQEVFRDIKTTKKIDHVPAIWRALASHPEHLQLCWTRLKAIMKPGKVDLLTKEIIALAVSATNSCRYCVNSHTAAVQRLGLDNEGLGEVMGQHGSIFAFGLVAFGFLCMGPVNIAVDSYGPVTDNAQSVFELAQTEHIPGIKDEIRRDFGFEPDFERGKHYLEANDSAGNTFKATAKPVLIGTAVVGATTMIFSIILLLGKQGMLQLSLTDAPVLLGLICGGAVVFWFSGASMQTVTTGAYRAVEYIKRNMRLDKTEADIEDSRTVVKICTQYAQAGMWNIFIALMSITLAFAFFNANFFVAYLISIAVFGLFQAIYMANAGGAWDNAKKLVEVDMKEKGTKLHEATVVGDTVGVGCDRLRQIEIEIVEGGHLDDRRAFLTDCLDAPAGLLITPVFARQDDQRPAETAGLGQAHAGEDAEATGLVTAAGDDPGADRDRFAAQPGIVALFQRRKKGIGIQVQDAALGKLKRHE